MKAIGWTRGQFSTDRPRSTSLQEQEKVGTDFDRTGSFMISMIFSVLVASYEFPADHTGPVHWISLNARCLAISA
jgi:hypothetical protein